MKEKKTAPAEEQELKEVAKIKRLLNISFSKNRDEVIRDQHQCAECNPKTKE